MEPVTRRKLLLGAAASVGCLALDGRVVEPNWIEVTRRRVEFPRALAAPVRLLHLSDLHASKDVPIPLIEHAIALGLAEKPDLICLTGDFITSREAHPRAEYVRALRRLTAAAPTFAVLGNHDGARKLARGGGYPDHRVVEAILGASGVELLHNRAIRFTAHGESLDLVGVGDLWADEVDGARAFRNINRDRNIVLLAHNPDTKDPLRAFPWDLMLSGHTHGGQVCSPTGAIVAPVHDWRYIEGLKPWGARQIHVTRGVGNIGGVRFLCRPEASMLTLV
jgi:predicted MPP superfamily phosphohydrolase